jgi:hypothetical protein
MAELSASSPVLVDAPDRLEVVAAELEALADDPERDRQACGS